ncbi:hypothetical protein D9757_011016 [Collybiopsis confluens]|uniref:F-box domain-containing protein n=1 Tax=Collybiopsis confluens TaxID=2823264 RepID=A0A8H5GD66_9AGAR|nr:hypothetical protein D9757_011016 [Collybiopsis confluens]
MRRRSQRLQQKITGSQKPSFTEISESESEDDTPVKREPPRKRVKRSIQSEPVATTISSTKKGKRRIPEQFRKVRGKTGMLEKLAKDVPLDVIFEIFCYLDPGDLFRLARTTRDLRDILMSKSSENVWRIAREGVEGIPPLPSDLNEPQFAHLLFESYCHNCGRKRCENILWSFRMRCCNGCLAVFGFLNRNDAEFFARIPDGLDIDPMVFPSEYILGKYHYTVVHPEIMDRITAFVKDGSRQKLLTVKGISLMPESRGEMRIAILSLSHSLILTPAAQYRILDRLEQIGWREEAEIIMKTGYRDDFSSHTLVRQTRKLTDYVWNGIEQALIDWLTIRKTQRLESLHQAAVKRRYWLLESHFAKIRSNQDFRDPFPDKSDVLTYKALEKLIWETPAEEELTSEFLQSKLLEFLPHIVEHWKSAALQSLVQVMQESRPNATELDLQLVTTVFQCSSCCDTMLYPQVLYHSCCFSSYSVNSTLGLQYIKQAPWSPRRLKLSEAGCRTAMAIVRGCSLDPATATIQDLWDANPLIECKKCETPWHAWEGGRLFMRWPAAIQHTASHAHRYSAPLIKPDDLGEEKRRILACEPLVNFVCGPAPSVCVHCHETQRATVSSLYAHLLTSHPDVIASTNPAVYSFPLSVEELRPHFQREPMRSLRDWTAMFRCKRSVDDGTVENRHAHLDLVQLKYFYLHYH